MVYSYISLPTTGRFTLLSVHFFFRVQYPRRCWEFRPWIIAHVFYEPLPNGHRLGCCCFFAWNMVVCFFEDLFEIFSSPSRPRISDDIKRKQIYTSVRPRKDRTEHVMKKSGFDSQKRRGHLCRQSALFAALPHNYLLYFHHWIGFGLHILLEVDTTLSAGGGGVGGEDEKQNRKKK